MHHGWQQRISSFFRAFLPRHSGAATEGVTLLTAVLRDLPDAAVFYDANFTVRAVNRAAETLFGIGREEVEGLRVDPGWAQKPRYRLFAQTLFPSLAPASAEESDSGAWPQIVSLAFENPPRRFLVSTIRLPGGTDGETLFVKIVRNETREREIIAARNEFIGVAAHQLRTPLTALRWSLESVLSTLARREDAAPLVKESFALVDRSLKIVNDFLDATKIEEGKFGFEYETADLAALIETLIATIAPIAAQYGITVSYLHETAPSLPLRLDASRLGTALLNLLDNAVRYNVRGGAVVITLVRESDRAKITIADTGIGIPKGEEEKIFKKLERGSNAIQTEPNGSGLGLYITKNIIEAHGGAVTVASEEHRGTTFTVTLPLNNH